MISANRPVAADERDAAAWVAGTLLANPQYVAARVWPPATLSESAAWVGRRDALHRVEVETATGRSLRLMIVLDEVQVSGSLSDLPAWTVPGPFADGLAVPGPRLWVALVVGRATPTGMFIARDYVVRRLVMDRYLEAARNGVLVKLSDNAVIHDLGRSALDLIKHRCW